MNLRSLLVQRFEMVTEYLLAEFDREAEKGRLLVRGCDCGHVSVWTFKLISKYFFDRAPKERLTSFSYSALAVNEDAI